MQYRQPVNCLHWGVTATEVSDPRSEYKGGVAVAFVGMGMGGWSLPAAARETLGTATTSRALALGASGSAPENTMNGNSWSRTPALFSRAVMSATL